MTARKVKTDYNSEYINGNAIRKAEPAGIPVKRNPDVKRRTGINYMVRRNQEKALFMDFPYVVTLTIAAVCALWICVNYLHVQSLMSARIKTIEGLEQQLETLKSENDAAETRNNTYLDLDYIYKVATEDLGMVYANKNQVLLYDRTESEYVRQYEDIPK